MLNDTHRDRVPRTLNDAFGPYAKLHVEPDHYRLRGALWALAYGVAIGGLFYLVVLVRA